MQTKTPSKKEMKKYTIEEVCRHNSKLDAWTIIKDKVYDISGFLTEHPGGYQEIARAIGRNGTIYFCKYHSLLSSSSLLII